MVWPRDFATIVPTNLKQQNRNWWDKMTIVTDFKHKPGLGGQLGQWNMYEI